FQAYRVSRLMPSRRHSSRTFAPASASLTAATFCSSVNLLLRMTPPRSVRRSQIISGSGFGGQLTARSSVTHARTEKMIGTSPSDSLDETCINSSFGQRLWHMDRILLAAAHAEMIAGLRPQAVTHGPLGRKERSDKRSA